MGLKDVWAMAGPCPVPFGFGIGHSPTTPEVVDWYQRVRAWGLERGMLIRRDAVASWAMYGLDPDTYEQVARVIQAIEDGPEPPPRGGPQAPVQGPRKGGRGSPRERR